MPGTTKKSINDIRPVATGRAKPAKPAGRSKKASAPNPKEFLAVADQQETATPPPANQPKAIGPEEMDYFSPRTGFWRVFWMVLLKLVLLSAALGAIVWTYLTYY